MWLELLVPDTFRLFRAIPRLVSGLKVGNTAERGHGANRLGDNRSHVGLKNKKRA